MHLSQERFELFLGNSNEVALMQVRVVFFLTNRILPQVPVSGWKWSSMFTDLVKSVCRLVKKSNEWVSGRTIICKTENFVPLVVPR